MIYNPHDALFKGVFGKPEHARGALRALVPTELAEALDWQTLTLRPGAPNGLNAMAQVLCYILEVSDNVDKEALAALLQREIGPEAKDAIVTVGQQLREEGRQEGRQQGFQEMLLHLLRQRFGHEVDAHVEQRVAAASIEQIEAWTTRVLSAATLAELLAD